MTQTVKVQRPIMTNDAAAPWLIYDRERKHEESVPGHLIPSHVRKAMGDDFKAYFRGAWWPALGWSLGRRVESEDW